MSAYVEASMARIALLEENWDDEGSPPVSATALQLAQQLLDAVHDCPEPIAVVPCSGGGVQVEWRIGQKEVEIEIGPTGDHEYLTVDRTGTAPVYEEICPFTGQRTITPVHAQSLVRWCAAA